MKTNSISTQNFNGFKITKAAQTRVTEMMRNELNRANELYYQRLAAKHANARRFRKFHDEKLFKRCFDSSWDKLDMYDAVMMDYSINPSRDMLIKTNKGKLVVDTFSNATGERVKISSEEFSNPNNFFGYFINEYFHVLKKHKVNK